MAEGGSEHSAGVAVGGRLVGIDRLRGLVIMLMALDHARHFLEPAHFSPEDLSTTTPAYFLSRWVTHLCAPVFVFLAGSGAALQRSPEGLAGRLAKRGLWLILLELTWVSFSWSFGFSRSHLGVLWAIGAAMVLLAPLVRLPRPTIAVVGLLMPLVGLYLPPESLILPARLLIFPGSIAPAGHQISVSYAVLPWFGVLAMGWGSLPIQLSPKLRSFIGITALAAYFAMRLLGVGDPRPWLGGQPDAWLNVAELINPSKYPPSLAYQALFLGIGLLLIGPLGRLPAAIAKPLDVFGRVPLFFYLLHLPLYHLIGVGISTLLYDAQRVPADSAPALGWMIAAWVSGLAVMTWPSVRWAELKARHHGAWWTAYC